MTEHDPTLDPADGGAARVRALTFTGLSDDKSTVLLTDESEAIYTVAVTPALRAALPRTPAPSGRTPAKVDTPMEPSASALRPRDIQSRIRAGESPETVAAAAQTTVDKIMAFAMPVLAERAHVAERAQRASLRRSSATAQVQPQTHLADAVGLVLRTEHVDPESVEWDACRRDDGRWTLTASYGLGQSRRAATFVYDAAGRYVVADDDESRRLVGERVRTQASRPDEPSLLDELGEELGDDAIDLVSNDPRNDPGNDTADLTEASRALRAVPDAPIADHADADWIVTQVTARAPQPDAEPENAAESDAGPQAPRKRKGRAPVPSWDEIMFGSGGPE